MNGLAESVKARLSGTESVPHDNWKFIFLVILWTPQASVLSVNVFHVRSLGVPSLMSYFTRNFIQERRYAQQVGVVADVGPTQPRGSTR
jgi:hypothetical protein